MPDFRISITATREADTDTDIEPSNEAISKLDKNQDDDQKTNYTAEVTADDPIAAYNLVTSEESVDMTFADDAKVTIVISPINR